MAGGLFGVAGLPATPPSSNQSDSAGGQVQVERRSVRIGTKEFRESSAYSVTNAKRRSAERARQQAKKSANERG